MSGARDVSVRNIDSSLQMPLVQGQGLLRAGHTPRNILTRKIRRGKYRGEQKQCI